MPSFAAIRTSNAAFTHSSHPVAVFVGGTSGIGEGMARAFAEHTKGDSDIIIVGRNRASAENIFSALPMPTSTSTSESDKSIPAREFVQCDVTLMKNIQEATRSILTKYPKINYLVISPGVMTMAGRDETEEGIDKKLAVHYYARWKFLSDLLPALKKANEAGEKGAVMSVMAAGKGGAIDLEDLALKKGYSVQRAALIAPTYNDLMLEVSLYFNDSCFFFDFFSLPVFLRASTEPQTHPRLSGIRADPSYLLFSILVGSCLWHYPPPSHSPLLRLGVRMWRVHVERHIPHCD